MSEISSTGDGLTILIACDQLDHHDWMSFVSWYSIYKNLPDAKVIIACKRGQCNYQFGGWTRRCNVEFFQHPDDTDPHESAINKKIIFSQDVVQVISPDVMVLDRYIGEKIVSSKSSELATFVSYLEGCGGFVLSEWIDKSEVPFGERAKRFIQKKITVNESRIIKLWERAYKAYTATM
jgi:hypothetical protein